jgi:tetratricopeptide (TPR) repeat protein
VPTIRSICSFLLRLPGACFNALFPDNRTVARTYFSQGNESFKKQEYAKAIGEYTESIGSYPKFAETYFNRGAAYKQRQEYDKAIDDFTQAIRLDPKDADAYTFRGNAYLAKDAYELAIADYTRSIELNPKDPAAYVNRGAAYRQSHEFERAIADYNEAIRLDPKLAPAYFNRGNLFLTQEECDKAILDFSEAIRLYPADPTTNINPEHNPLRAYVNRALAFSMRGEDEKMLADLSAVNSIDAQGLDKTCRDYAEADHWSPIDLKACGILAWTFATCAKDALRNGKRARELATRAAQLSDWKDKHYLQILASAHAECGDFDEAVKWQKKAIELGFDDNERLEKARLRLQFYEQGKPCRDE